MREAAYIARLLVALCLVGLGVAGLHLKIEYSGWVLFVGLIAIL